MNFFVNPISFTSNFSVPSAVVDNYLRIAGAVQLKVLLFALKNISADGIDPKQVGDALSISAADAGDALNFWADAGILTKPSAEPKPSEPEKPTKKAVI